MNGLDSVGDDYVWSTRALAVVAHAVFTVLKQDREGLRRVGVPDSDGRRGAGQLAGQSRDRRGAYLRKGLVERMEVTALLIPEIARARRTTSSGSRLREAALALAPSGVFQLPGDTVEGFRLLADLAVGSRRSV